jgi:predicted DNA-binding transcriptional regulator YafY
LRSENDLLSLYFVSCILYTIGDQNGVTMASEQLLEVTQAQRDRLAFIDLRLRFLGDVGRQDLVARFSIQSAAASRDLAQYREVAPRNLDYDPKDKVYVRATGFRPIFDFPSDRVLTWLAKGFGDGEPTVSKCVVLQEEAKLLGRVDLELLSVLTRSIHQGTAVEMAYRSMTEGLTTREIVPIALLDDGLRWHVRAFDRRSLEFRDFALARFDDASLVAGPVVEHEKAPQDIQWTRITELQLVPHPANVRHPDAIEAEFAMRDGVFKVRLRAAMAGYLLRRWNVDCTDDHSLKGGEFHLWLRNRGALYGVTNLDLVPGYDSRADD